MRQILFKAKRKDNGEWVEGTVFYPESGITVMFPNKRAFKLLYKWEGTKCQRKIYVHAGCF